MTDTRHQDSDGDCYNCEKPIPLGTHIDVRFRFQTPDDGICGVPKEHRITREQRKKVLLENGFDFKEDDDSDEEECSGTFIGVPPDLEGCGGFFCSYQCLEEATGGEVYWEGSDPGDTDTDLERRLVDVEEICPKCGTKKVHDHIICWIIDPSMQHKKLPRE